MAAQACSENLAARRGRSDWVIYFPWAGQASTPLRPVPHTTTGGRVAAKKGALEVSVIVLPPNPPPIRNLDEAKAVIDKLWDAVRRLTAESGRVAGNHDFRIEKLEQKLGIEP